MKPYPNCSRCRDREICEAPCEAMERALKAVTFGSKEINIGIPLYAWNDWPEPAPPKKTLSERDQTVRDRDYAILILLGLGMKRETIRQVLGMSKEKFRSALYLARKKHGLIARKD